MLTRRALIAALGLAPTAMPFSREAFAAYPDRPIRVIVPFAAGGNADIVGRLIGERISSAVGQPVVVDNRGGAGGSVGAEAVARSTPDGYTLLVGSNGPLTVNPFVQAKLGYDPLKDFAPVALTSYVPHVIILNSKVDAKTIAELIALSKKEQISVATSGVGSATHMTLERFKATTGANVVHIPYRSGGALMPDLIGGSIQAAMTEFSTALPLHKGRQANIVAIAATHRSRLAPDVASFIESGVKDFTAQSYIGILAPAGTPAPIIAQLQEAIARGLVGGPTPEKLREMGSEIATAEQMTPEGFARFIRADYENMREDRKDCGDHAAMTRRAVRTTFTRAAVFALGVFLLPPVSYAINAVIDTFMSLPPHDIGHLGFISPAQGQPAALTQSQAEALDRYNNALKEFRAVLSQRRAQINARQQLPNLPGQALYLARNNMISAYKDLTDTLPAKIGRPNKFAIPPAYFDADNEPLLDEYASVFSVMQAPPANVQNSATPFRDVVDLATAIARAKGLDRANAELAGRISLGLFFAETNGNQNIGNARSNTYKGSLQTGPSEDRNGQRKWAAIKTSIAAFDPALISRDDKEAARVGGSDHRFNHWTAVRDGLMNAHAELFLRIPAIVKALPNAIDQMKLYELIQIIPSPTKAALNSGNLTGHRISDPTIMGYLRNNSIFTFGKADRAKTSATLREILDAMWLFNDKFERALAKYNEIKAQQRS